MTSLGSAVGKLLHSPSAAEPRVEPPVLCIDSAAAPIHCDVPLIGAPMTFQPHRFVETIRLHGCLQLAAPHVCVGLAAGSFVVQTHNFVEQAGRNALLLGSTFVECVVVAARSTYAPSCPSRFGSSSPPHLQD